MIASLRGTVVSADTQRLVVEVDGVGYAVEVTSSHASSLRVGESALVLTELVVREDSLTLFGFATEPELKLFSALTSVSGVGPRSALGILSAMTPEEIVTAVASEHDLPFKQVTGIGPKTAKLIVVSLHGKLDSFAYLATAGQRVSSQQSAVESTVVQALVGLGWSANAAHEAVETAKLAGADVTEQELLRASLALLQNTPGRS